MSTYYYVVCDEHKQCCDAVSRTVSGIRALGHSFMLGDFLVDHCGCGVRLTNEHDETIAKYVEPYADAPDPHVEREEREAELLARALDAEAQLRKLKKLYGGTHEPT